LFSGRDIVLVELGGFATPGLSVVGAVGGGGVDGAMAPAGGGSRSSSRNCDGNTGDAGISIDVLNPVVLVFQTTATRTLEGDELRVD
jgi:hypothetical protein